ncbi:MAG TPA: hypothetical protein VFY75_00580 [Solirubrobacterales bacterium]|nr:hypothetical protein [Solirubrobacterales bacterium]
MAGRGKDHVRFFACAGAAALLTLLLASCGGGQERSADAYCRAFYEHAAPIRKSYVEADERMEEDPVGSIVTLLGSPGDIAVIFDAMVDHAPDEIRADTEAARDAVQDQQDALGDALSDPLGALGGGLIEGLTTSGSFARVDSYLNEHCPVDSELAQEVIAEYE